MAKDRTYEPRDNSDGLPRASVGVFLRLTQNQVVTLEQLAGAKPLPEFIREIAEAAINQMVPPE